MKNDKSTFVEKSIKVDLFFYKSGQIRRKSEQ